MFLKFLEQIGSTDAWSTLPHHCIVLSAFLIKPVHNFSTFLSVFIIMVSFCFVRLLLLYFFIKVIKKIKYLAILSSCHKNLVSYDCNYFFVVIDILLFVDIVIALAVNALSLIHRQWDAITEIKMSCSTLKL